MREAIFGNKAEKIVRNPYFEQIPYYSINCTFVSRMGKHSSSFWKEMFLCLDAISGCIF